MNNFLLFETPPHPAFALALTSLRDCSFTIALFLSKKAAFNFWEGSQAAVILTKLGSTPHYLLVSIECLCSMSLLHCGLLGILAGP